MIEDIFPGAGHVMANFGHQFNVTYKSQPGKTIFKNWNSMADSDRIALDGLLTESSSKPRIVVGADHAGFRAKETIKKYLEGAGYPVEDVGTHSEESVDYPDYAKAVGERVAAGNDSLGVVVCGTGIGVSIAANKLPRIRAPLPHDYPTTCRPPHN